MDRLTAMRHFVTVVEAGSFSNAARRLNVANATVTQSIQGLEAHLGVRLLHRTTRRMTVTWEGRAYAAQCQTLLHQLDAAERNVAQGSRLAVGELCVEMPSAIGQIHFVPRLQEFSRRYPNVQLRVFLNPSPSGLVEEGIDVALQIGALEDSSLIARKLHVGRSIACASPDYLRRCGVPGHPADLQNHDCLSFFSPKTFKSNVWQFRRGGEEHSFVPSADIEINSSEALIRLATEGVGVIYMLDLLVVPQIASGALVPLLPDWSTLERGIYVVSPARHNLPERVRAFTDFAAGVFAGLETLDNPRPPGALHAVQ